MAPHIFGREPPPHRFELSDIAVRRFLLIAVVIDVGVVSIGCTGAA
jgi:hypothetical protein